MKINLLELFSGVGGFSVGIEQAGIEIGWHGFSDIDKYANEIFKRRFPNAEELGSVVDVDPRKLPRIDLVTFGFPCQDLSIAGKRKGFEGSRSSLFFEAMRIIEAKKPSHFIFENVEGIFSSNEGKDFEIILRTIADCGYDGQWQLLNTRWFLPQNRSRCYFVGHLRGASRPKVFPIEENGGEDRQSRIRIIENLKGEGGHECHNVHATNGIAPTVRNNHGKITMISCAPSREYGWKDISPTLCARDYKDPKLVQIAKVANGDAGRVFDPNGIACTLKAEGGGWGAKTGLYKVEYGQKALNETLEQNDLKDDDIKALDLYNRKAQDISPTLTEPHHNTLRLFDKSDIRRLTPTECERLQGFPDGWTEGQSDTQRYRQMGNAVSVPVVKAVVERLYGIRT